MPKGSSFSGPIRSTSANNVEGRVGSITISAQAASTGAVYTIADADALVGDVICVSPRTALETGVILGATYCIADGVVSIQIHNSKPAAALTGGTQAFNYVICK